jgi:hypothetical protein
MITTRAARRGRNRLPRLKAAAYIRISAEEHPASLENQREQIRIGATKRGFCIFHFCEER